MANLNAGRNGCSVAMGSKLNDCVRVLSNVLFSSFFALHDVLSAIFVGLTSLYIHMLAVV